MSRRTRRSPLHAAPQIAGRRDAADRQATADVVEDLAHLLRCQAIGEDVQEVDQDLVVRLGEEGVRLRGELVRVRGLAGAASGAVLADQTVPFERRQMAPDAIVRQVQGLRELVDRAAGPAEQHDDLAAGRGEEPSTPTAHDNSQPHVQHSKLLAKNEESQVIT